MPAGIKASWLEATFRCHHHPGRYTLCIIGQTLSIISYF